MTDVPFLQGLSLSVRLGQFHLDGVSLTVERGEYCAILGETGAGKSVLLEALIGMYPSMGGQVFLEGREITRLPPEERGLAIVYQDYMLFPHLNVYENIAFGLRRARLSRFEETSRVRAMAERLAIEALLERDVRTLSGGEKQRTAIARALVTKPKVLLMDEAFSALDASTRERMRRFIGRLVKDLGTTVVHVTHDVDDVWALADKVVIMFDGKVLQAGPPLEVFSRPLPGDVADFVGACNLFSCRAEGSEQEGLAALRCGEALFLSTDAVEPGREVLASVRPESILLAREAQDLTARNQIRGRICSTERRGPLVRICGETEAGPMTALLTASGLEALDLSVGDEVFFIFKAGHVKILRDGEVPKAS